MLNTWQLETIGFVILISHTYMRTCAATYDARLTLYNDKIEKFCLIR